MPATIASTVVLDAASLAGVTERVPSQAGTSAQADADTSEDEPQLCPAPSNDVPHGASEQAKAYQEFISALNNPQRPLKRGDAVSLIDPETGRRVVFDDCRESDGTMIEAKGPGYAKMLRYRYFSDEVFPRRWTNQGGRQVSAAGARGVDWFFAEDAAALKAKEIFSQTDALQRLRVLTVPAVQP